MYTEENKLEDFNYFLENYEQFMEKHGENYIAIRNKEILGVYKYPEEVIFKLSDTYKPGSYIVQRCRYGSTAHQTALLHKKGNKMTYV